MKLSSWMVSAARRQGERNKGKELHPSTQGMIAWHEGIPEPVWKDWCELMVSFTR